MADQSKTALITTMKNEFYKMHYTYDGSNRTTYIYQARNDAADGAPCLVTKYTYVGATALVEGSIEFQGEWDETWDIDPS